jgi:hypothetical protein
VLGAVEFDKQIEPVELDPGLAVGELPRNRRVAFVALSSQRADPLL